jgi:hypothetical protein
MAWMKSLPSGVLNQWIAFDSIEPIGEEWEQTASIVHAINLPLYARAGQEMPEVADFMPTRYRRPKRSAKTMLKQAAKASTQIAGQVKAMFGLGAK